MTRRFYVFCALMMSILLAGAVGAGCAGSTSDPEPDNNNGGSEACEDRDQDGYLGLTAQCEKGSDCDDSRDSVHPGAEEICGDGRDNDCTQGDAICEEECIDADNDRYGVGDGCFGPDCDDTNPNANPGAQEVCGNTVDEDCDGTANECPTDCTDADGDGFGVAGENSDCPSDGDDCDDTDDTINPNAEEVCNGEDDNCDGDVDECAQADATCDGTTSDSRCVVSIGGACQSDSDCAENARCDANVSECRLAEGESCSTGECLEGYGCDNGTCSGDFCSVTTCSGDRDQCDSDAQRCVECRHWDESAGWGADDCPGDETCTLEGWCATSILVSNSDEVTGHEPLTTDIYEMSIALADCWIDKSGGSSNDMCAVLYVGENVTSPLTQSEHKDAYTDGHLDDLIDSLQNTALIDLWGQDGWFDAVNVDFKSDPQPDTFFEYCIWFDTYAVDELIIDECASFSP
jgi:hypothetical protein